MRPAARAIMAAAGASGGAPPAFSPADLSDKILYLDAGLGVTLSGSDVTAWADQSGAGRTITIAGAPQHAASDANLNGLPSITLGGSPDKITADILDRGDIAFAAGVFFMSDTATRYAWDGPNGTDRLFALFNTGLTVRAGPANRTIATGIFAAAGQRRVLLPYDGVSVCVVNESNENTGVANTVASSVANWTIGSALNSSGPCVVAELVACSSVPSSGDITSLTNYYASKYT